MNNYLELNRSYEESGGLPPFDLARARIIAEFPAPGRTAELPVEAAVGRILADPVRAAFDVPPADVAEVDGYAVASGSTADAGPGRPILVHARERVDTGRSLPPGTDAVVPVEWFPGGTTRLALEKPLRPGDGVRQAGAELRRGTVLLPAGHRLRPADIGALVAAGTTVVRVRAARVGVVPTGGELVSPGVVPGPGESVASNPVAIRALLGPQGAETVVHDIVPDDPGAVRSAILALCADADLVVVCGGSGRGTRDVAFDVVRSLGETVIDGVAARPGRAFLVVRAGRTPVVALPGRARPVGLLTEYFLVPLLDSWGLRAVAPPRARAVLGTAIHSHPRFTETVPLSVAVIGSATAAVRQPRGERGVLSRFRANARLLVPEGVGGFAAGDAVEVELLEDPDSPAATILVVGEVDGLEIASNGYRVAPVPCHDRDEVAALAARGACHAGVVAAPPECLPARRLVREGAPDLWVLTPPGLDCDPKVRYLLDALGCTG